MFRCVLQGLTCRRVAGGRPEQHGLAGLGIDAGWGCAIRGQPGQLHRAHASIHFVTHARSQLPCKHAHVVSYDNKALVSKWEGRGMHLLMVFCPALLLP